MLRLLKHEDVRKGIGDMVAAATGVSIANLFILHKPLVDPLLFIVPFFFFGVRLWRNDPADASDLWGYIDRMNWQLRYSLGAMLGFGFVLVVGLISSAFQP